MRIGIRAALWPLLLALPCAHAAQHTAQPESKVHNVVLVTLDGVRVQEMFGGLDLDVLRSTLGKDAKVEDSPVYQRYWATTPQERRAKVMPFFWSTLMQHGSIAGNPALGSRVQITNTLGFSYPGYSEILTGRAHDEAITSNANTRYPFPTVLELVKRELDIPAGQVATFASWETFNWIGEHEEGATFINAGFERYPHAADPSIEPLNAVQDDVRAFDGARFDAFTERFALAHLENTRPRLLYVAFDETDEWAHLRNYGYTLDAMARADRFLQQLWAWLQAQPQYRDNTTLIVTTDHGRGNTPKDWGDHGKVEGAQNIWLALISPLDARRGEWSDAPTLYQNQIAATIANAFGQDYSKQDPQAGKAIGFRARAAP